VWAKLFGQVRCPDTFLSSGLHGIAAVDLEDSKRRQWQLFIYSFCVPLNNLHCHMWYHRSFPLTIVATQLLQYSFNFIWPGHRGVKAPCFIKICYTWILNNTRSCRGTTLINFFDPLQMLITVSLTVVDSEGAGACSTVLSVQWPVKCVPWSDSIWIGAPQSGRTSGTLLALLLRVGIASTHLENFAIITRQ